MRNARTHGSRIAMLVVGVLACAAVALPASATAVSRPGAGAAAHGCSSLKVRDLRIVRLHGTLARLSWTASAGAGTQYLVRRNGRTGGETRSAAIELRAVPGRMTSYGVVARRGGSGGRCTATLKAAIAFHPPGRVSGLRVLHY